MPQSFDIQFPQVILVLFVAMLLFVAGKAAGAFLETSVKERMTKKRHGTQEGCIDCIAMQFVTGKAPEMEKKQDTLRNNDLPAIQKDLGQISASVMSLDERVKKLFSMIEEDWKEEREQLRQALRDKNTEIERMKSKHV
jgi:peptidoglycan hydrolase CwlO-like protein